MLSKSQQVFASAYKDIQRLIWNFHSENSTEKMLLIVSKAETHLLKESCKVKKDFNSKEEDLFLVRYQYFFFDFVL